MKEAAKLAQEWLDRASNDLKYAYAGEKETGQHPITCFLCHQAVEKLLKGLMVLAGERPQKTHQLGVLLARALAHFPSFRTYQKEVQRLNKFYQPARYPDDMTMEFTTADAKKALEITQQLIDLAKIEFSTNS